MEDRVKKSLWIITVNAAFHIPIIRGAINFPWTPEVNSQAAQ